MELFAGLRLDLTAVLIVVVGVQLMRSALNVFQAIGAIGCIAVVARVPIAYWQVGVVAAISAVVTVFIRLKNATWPGLVTAICFVLVSGDSLLEAWKAEYRFHSDPGETATLESGGPGSPG